MSILVLCPFGLDAGLLTKAAELAQGGTVRALIPDRDTLCAAGYGAGLIHTLPDALQVAD